MVQELPSKRVLIKLSGESLATNAGHGIDSQKCTQVAEALKNLHDTGLQISIVIGGGNIIRGVSASEIGMSRTPADQMGMLATIINGKALEQALEKINCPVALFSALECPRVADTYKWHSATQALQDGKLVIFVGGTGNPFFSTDSAAALRASEIEADILLKATKVDGIYDKDPVKHPDAVKYTRLSFKEVIENQLAVMDTTAVVLCQNAGIPIFVFNMQNLMENKMVNLLNQKSDGTLVTGEIS